MKNLKEKRKKKITRMATIILGIIGLVLMVVDFSIIGTAGVIGCGVVVLLDLTTIGNTGNTGNQTYKFSMSAMKGFIIVPMTWSANTAYISSMITNLQADTVKAVGSRIYPIWRIGEITDKSTEDAIIKLGLGAEVNGPKGKYSYVYEIMGGEHDLQVELAKFAGQGFKVLLVDDNDTICGTSTATAGSMAGFSYNLAVMKPKWLTSTTENTKYLVQISLTDTREAFENLRVVKLAVSVETNVVGCLNVTLADNGIQSTTHIFVNAKTNQGLIDLYDTYDDEIAAVAAWDVYNVTAAAAIVPSGVAKVAGTKGWDLTGVFPTGNTIRVRLAGPAALRVLLVGVIPGNGFESDYVDIVIP